jgi:hypothetical protein
VLRDLSALIDHISPVLHPLLRGLLITFFVITIHLGYVAAARVALSELAASQRFVKLAEQGSPARALWRMFAQRDPGEKRRVFLFSRAALVFVDLMVAVVFGGYTVFVATLQHTPRGFASTAVPVLAWLFAAAFVLWPVRLVTSGVEPVLAGHALLADQPLSWRGSKWVERQRRLNGRRFVTAGPTTVGESRFDVTWADLVDKDLARTAAARAYRPFEPALYAGVMLASLSSYLHPALRNANGEAAMALPDAIVLMFVGYQYGASFIPLDLRVQTSVLWCLQHDAGPAAGVLVDPLGQLRAGLARSRRLLLKLARRTQRYTRAVGTLPVPLTLRGVAAKVEGFLESPASLQGEIPTELRRTLRMTAALVTGPRDPRILAKLATRVGAYDAKGSPAPALLPARNVLAKVPSALADIVTLLRNLALFVLIPAGFIAYLLHVIGLADLTKFH